MAAGLPLVAPNSGGLTSYANQDNAWLADPNPAAFTTALNQIVDDPYTAGARARAARVTSERFDWEQVTAGFFELYDELHALVRGTRQEPVSAPAFYSTAGNQFGWER